MSTNERIIISIDPGHTTGVARFMDGELVDAFTTTSPHIGLVEYLRGRHVVAERGPVNRNHNEQACTEVEEIIKRATGHVTWVAPSEYKPHPASHTRPNEGNRHERDAIGLGRWFIKTKVAA